MARSGKAETRLWVWSGSRVNTVLRVTEDVALRRQKTIPYHVTITTMPTPDDRGIHGESFDFDRGAVVRQLPCSDRRFLRFRFSEERIVRPATKRRKAETESFFVDVLVAKNRKEAWVVKP